MILVASLSDLSTSFVVEPGSTSHAERQILARLQHPGVIQLLDAGTASDGRPWFVIELIEGMSVTKFCREHHVSIPDRLRLFESVCDAVHHVHQKGVLHRDLKSSNVIVTQVSDRWIPKVIDFGVACLSTASDSNETSLPLQSGCRQTDTAVLMTGHILGIWFTPDGNRLIAAAHSASGGADVMVWNAMEPTR